MRYIFLLFFILFSGCVSSGRISLIDIDLRTPDQIEAYAKESEAVYLSNKDALDETREAEATKIKNVSVIMNMITIIKGRIRILSFEWCKAPKKDL